MNCGQALQPNDKENMASQAETLLNATRMVDELSRDCPSADEFDFGFGLDFSSAILNRLDIVPQIISYILAKSDAAKDAKRGHLLGLAFAAVRQDILDQLRSQGRHSLVQEITEAIRGGYSRFIRDLQDSHAIVRYWAIWGIRASDMSDTRAVLAAHLSNEPSVDNRNVILSLIDPNWTSPEPTRPPGDHIPF